jgi:LacI family transcriptional regulator
MSKTIKMALISSFGGRWDHRLLTGGLRYADTHSGLVIGVFSPIKDMTSVTTEVESWGAQGIYGILNSKDLQTLDGSLSHKIPIVNCCSTDLFQNSKTQTDNFNIFLEKARTHLRDLRVRSFGMFLHAENGIRDECFIGKFRDKTQPTKPRATTLVLPVADNFINDPDADVRPVPEALVTWLRDLPKPAAIICPHPGSSRYLAKCCSALSLMVPKDIAIVAPDETDSWLAGEPALTSILPSVETFGTEAVRLLVGILQKTEKPPQPICLEQVDVAPRKTTGRRPVFDIAAALDYIDICLEQVETVVRESSDRRHPVCDIAAALEYIDANATNGITVGQVIKETQRVSVPTFHSHFREATGKSPAQAIRDRQLQEARRLLTDTDLPLHTISDLSGFSCRNVMTRIFNTVEFMSPRKYRLRHQRINGN